MNLTDSLSVICKRGFVFRTASGVGIGLRWNGPEPFDVGVRQGVLDSTSNYERLIPLIGLANGIFLSREIRDGRGCTVGHHNLHVAFPITFAKAFGSVEGTGFGGGNSEKNTVNALARILRGFDVAFARAVGVFFC